MKRKLQNIAYLLMAAAFVASCSEKKQISEFPDWAWTDFQRPEGAFCRMQFPVSIQT